MIPTLNISQCRARRQLTGELAFEFEPEADLVEIPFVAFKGPVHVHLGYAIAEDDKVEVEAAISFTLAGACSRCLEPAENLISDTMQCLFERGTGDGESYGFLGGVVNFGEMLRDAVLFALPSRILCKGCSEE